MSNVKELAMFATFAFSNVIYENEAKVSSGTRGP